MSINMPRTNLLPAQDNKSRVLSKPRTPPQDGAFKVRGKAETI